MASKLKIKPRRRSAESSAREERAIEESSLDIALQVIEKLRAIGQDPIVILARYAIGDVVGLGLMSQEEYDADAEYGDDDELIRKSGREIALSLISPKVRMDAARELAQYVHAKKKAGDDLIDDRDTEAVVFYLPKNDRERPALPQEKAIEYEELN